MSLKVYYGFKNGVRHYEAFFLKTIEIKFSHNIIVLILVGRGEGISILIKQRGWGLAYIT